VLSERGWHNGEVPQRRWTERRWIDQSQPQTLQGAVIFSYLNAALSIVYSVVLHTPLLLAFLIMAVAAFGIANGRKIAYWAGVVIACLYLLGELTILVRGGNLGGVLDLLFAGILVVLLLHPESRHYVRTWFR
jgi:hypothetical protein